MNCRGDLVMMKSQTPFRPRPGSTASSTPEKRPNRSPRDRRNSSKRGAMMNSDLAFSVFTASARVVPSARAAAKSSRSAEAGTYEKRVLTRAASQTTLRAASWYNVRPGVALEVFRPQLQAAQRGR
jgi:hypothetical protein